MAMKDYLVKALAYNNQVRAYAVRTTESVDEARRRHNTGLTTSDALGRSMTAGVILGAMLKDEEKLTIKINGDGPIGTIIVDSNAKGEVRGYVTNPFTDLDLNEQGKLDVKGAVGENGIFSVSKDVGLHQSFIGQVPLVSGGIEEDFTSYLLNSEQTLSVVGLGVLINNDNSSIQAAGGFIIQLMPGAGDEIIYKIKEQLELIAPISSMIVNGMTPEQILNQILGVENVSILEQMPVQFQCQCSEERISNAIISLGSEEILDMIRTDGQAEAICHICNEAYHFSKEQLEELMEAAD